MQLSHFNILLVGGGIGGLTAALCLAKQGFNVRLFEQSSEFLEAGAGIQLSPNCARVLHYLGLEQALRQHAFFPQATQFRHWSSGSVIGETSLGDAAVEKFGAPYYHMHRGDLLRVLVDAATAEPNITLQLGAKVTGVENNSAGVRLSVNDQLVAGDTLVGADGIHSQIRRSLWGDEAPSFTGNVAWRALVPVERLPKNLILPMSTAWWGPGKHFVHYYVRGGSLVNCVCVVEKDGWEVESWTTPGDPAELLKDFSGWHDDIQQLLAHADQDSLYKWALFDREPMSKWGQGPVTLLGDACHPTLPFMAQGAAMAIEDAAVLAGCLSQGGAGDTIESKLQAYEALRRPRTAGIQAGSRRNAKVFHLSGVKAWLRNRAVRAAGSRAMDKLYSYNALEIAKLES